MKTVMVLLLASLALACSSSEETTTRETVLTVQPETIVAQPPGWSSGPVFVRTDTVYVDKKPEGDIRIVIKRDTVRVNVTPAPVTIQDIDTVYVTKTETTRTETPTFWEQIMPWLAGGFLVILVLIALRFAKVL